MVTIVVPTDKTERWVSFRRISKEKHSSWTSRWLVLDGIVASVNSVGNS